MNTTENSSLNNKDSSSDGGIEIIESDIADKQKYTHKRSKRKFPENKQRVFTFGEITYVAPLLDELYSGKRLKYTPGKKDIYAELKDSDPLLYKELFKEQYI